MRKHEYLGIFSDNRAAILSAAELGFDAPVFGCPGWDVAGLTVHMGGVYTFWLKWVRERPRAWSPEAMVELSAEREAALPGFGAWRDEGYPAAHRPPGIIDFARSSGDKLALLLERLDPSEPVWSFYKSNQTAGFAQRRLAQETTIHRWDAEQAHQIQKPIPVSLALDGIEEYLTVIIQLGLDDHASERPSRFAGQRFSFRQTDGDSGWLVTFSPDGIHVADNSGPADVEVTASASDLFLHLMGRLPTGEVLISGDREIAAHWIDLAGTF